MKGAIVCFVLAGIVALFMMWLFIDWVLQKNAKAREARAMRIRDQQLRRYNMATFKGSKDRFL